MSGNPLEIEVGGLRLKGSKWEAPNYEKPPVLFVHGGPGLFGYMKAVGEELSREGYNCWDYYQRGAHYQGSSTEIGVDGHIADLHEIAAKMQEAYGQKPIVVAHSWGGILSLLTAAKHKDFAKLVLINAMPHTMEGVGVFAANIDARLNEDEQKLRVERQTQLATMEDGEAKEALFRVMGDDIYKTYQKTNLSHPFSQILDATDSVCFFQTHGSLAGLMMQDQVIDKEYAKVKIPVELIYGTYDPCPGQMVADSLGSLLSNFEFTAIADCGHYPWLENKETWSAAKSRLLQALQL